MLTILKTLVLLCNIVIFAILAYFIHPLDWQKATERPSIIGFGFMMVTLIADVALIAVG